MLMCLAFKYSAASLLWRGVPSFFPALGELQTERTCLGLAPKAPSFMGRQISWPGEVMSSLMEKTQTLLPGPSIRYWRLSPTMSPVWWKLGDEIPLDSVNPITTVNITVGEIRMEGSWESLTGVLPPRRGGRSRIGRKQTWWRREEGTAPCVCGLAEGSAWKAGACFLVLNPGCPSELPGEVKSWCLGLHYRTINLWEWGQSTGGF